MKILVLLSREQQFPKAERCRILSPSPVPRILVIFGFPAEVVRDPESFESFWISQGLGLGSPSSSGGGELRPSSKSCSDG